MKQNKEDFLTGVGAVDAEHVVLLDLTDQVGALLADENMLFKCADIRQLLKRLEDYTTMHFTHEEQLMEKMGYGGIEEQKKQHRMFVQKLEEFTDRVSKLSLGTQDAMIQDLFEYLQQWLQDHIKVEDMKYARFAMEKLKEIVDRSDNIVFFGGAGVSTESGIPDFRSTDGLYHQEYRYPPETILSHTFFGRIRKNFTGFTVPGCWRRTQNQTLRIKSLPSGKRKAN